MSKDVLIVVLLQTEGLVFSAGILLGTGILSQKQKYRKTSFLSVKLGDTGVEEKLEIRSGKQNYIDQGMFIKHFCGVTDVY